MKILLLPLILLTVSQHDVERAVMSHLNGHFPLSDAEYVCDFSRIDYSRLSDGPAGIETDSVAVDGYGKEKPEGQVVVFFSLFKDGQKVGRTNGTVRVGILKKVMTSAVPIKSGDPITLENVIYEIRDIASTSDEPVISDQETTGKVASRFIPAGKIVTRTMLKDPPLINPGDQVEIIFDNGRFSLNIGGVAKQEGSEGEKIRVMNIDTRKIIYATVADSATVTVTNREGI